MSVHTLPAPAHNRTTPPEPPDDMEARVTKLEALAEKTGERLGAIEKDVAVIKVQLTTFATKEDLHRELHAVTWKLVTAIVLAQLLPAIPTMLRSLKLIM